MILITGGTGFLGAALIKRLVNDYLPIRVVSRNEGKLLELKEKYPSIEIITGDISDDFVCQKATRDVTILFHLAAFKHVGLAEDQPYQCTLSNVTGTINLLKYFYGKTFISISTDKAAQVSGVYGASKLLMERVIQEFAKMNPTVDYRIVRYGNVLYSTGSVLCKWKKILQEGGEITITDPTATRYFWTVEQAIDLIFDCLTNAKTSEPYCPDMKSMSICDLLEAMQRKYGKAKSIKTIGLQPGENLHERILENGPSSLEAKRYSVDEILELI